MLRLRALNLIDKYKADTSGQVAVIFAVLALPILALTTFAVDYTEYSRVDSHVESALDDAALAAILNQTINENQRADVARQHFWENFDNKNDFALTVVESSKDRVELKAKGFVDLSVSDAFGINKFAIERMAVSETTRENVICILVLDPNAARALEVARGSDVMAIDCSVQVNSTNERAATVDRTSRMRAKSICVGGGTRGSFVPSVNTECRTVEDPYKDVIAPESGPCINDKKLKLKDKGQNATPDGTMLRPGTYCGGLSVSGLNIDFAPGTYIIQDGPLVFNRGSEAYADGVTFVFRGNRATLDIKNGSKLTAKAPSDGPLAGLIFFEDTHYTGGNGRKSIEAQNVLRGGSGMNITGTIYFPSQRLIIAGGSGISAKSPATSLIANTILFTQDADIIVRSDHQRAGLPPLLPRADEAARLVR